MKKIAKGALAIREWSTLLVLACLLPAAVATVFVIWLSYERERASIERTSIETARALMLAIDQDLASAQATVATLAASQSLIAGDLSDFETQARLALRDQRGDSIELTDPSGRKLIDTALAPGTPPPGYRDPRQAAGKRAGALPTVSDLRTDPLSGKLWLSVDAPVLRDGRRVYELSLRLSTEHFTRILAQQRFPPERIAIVFDSAGTIVARTHSPERFIGTPGTPRLIERIEQMPEGSVETRLLEGIPMITAFSRSSVSDWAVAIGIPLSGLNRELWRTLALVSAGAVVLLLTALLLARAVGARITRSIRALIAPAMALGHGEPVHVPTLPLREADDVGKALRQASDLLRERTAQRDEAERAERELTRVKQELEQSEALQRGIFDKGPDAILLVAPSGRILRANQQAARLFGYPRERLLALTAEDLVPPAERQRQAALRRDFLSDPGRRSIGNGLNLRGQRADGTEFPMDVMLSPLRTGDGDLVIATVRDASESRQKEEAIRAALTEKETLLKELYHRVKNNLQVITSLFNLQLRMLPEGLAHGAIKDAAGRVRAMALVHEKLYQSGNLSSISLDEYVLDLCRQLANAASAEEHGIRIEFDLSPIEVGLDVAVPLGLTLNELFCNSLKHAFPDERGGTITVRLLRKDGQTAELVVADDGIGFPEGLEVGATRSLGLRLVTALAAQIDGTLSMRNVDGACVSLVFPVARRTARPGDLGLDIAA